MYKKIIITLFQKNWDFLLLAFTAINFYLFIYIHLIVIKKVRLDLFSPEHIQILLKLALMYLVVFCVVVVPTTLLLYFIIFPKLNKNNGSLFWLGVDITLITIICCCFIVLIPYFIFIWESWGVRPIIDLPVVNTVILPDVEATPVKVEKQITLLHNILRHLHFMVPLLYILSCWR